MKVTNYGAHSVVVDDEARLVALFWLSERVSHLFADTDEQHAKHVEYMTAEGKRLA